MAPRKEEVRAPTGHRLPRAASKRRGGAVSLGWARSSYSRPITTAMVRINTKADSPEAGPVRTRAIRDQ